MLHIVCALTAFLIIPATLIVLWRGDWRKFGLKFAALIFAFTATIWLGGFEIAERFLPGIKTDSLVIVEWQIFGTLRNVAILMFVIAYGRDALAFKKRDRRRA